MKKILLALAAGTLVLTAACSQEQPEAVNTESTVVLKTDGTVDSATTSVETVSAE